ncbi:MAG: hypothetical protein PHE13_02320, partial [Bacteroidales bacterium]|nr:hypothetical protein [Bacteroidales bacterium]
NQSSQCSVTFLLRALDFANNCAIEYRNSSNRRLCVELALLKIANIMKKLQPNTLPPRQVIVEQPKEIINDELKEISNKDDIIEIESKQPVEKEEQKKLKGIIIPKTSSFSINVDIEKTIKKDQEERNKLNPPSIALDWDLFKTKLNEYADAIKDSMPNLFFILTCSEISNNNDNTVTITFLNSMQEKEFEASKHEIVRIIRKATQCDSFLFKTKLYQEEIKEKLYRPLDKFNFLAQKEPSLLKLRNEFDFDIDY